MSPTSRAARLAFRGWLRDARGKLALLDAALPPGDGVIDIGCGSGSVALLLIRTGHPVVAVDRRDWTMTDDVRPVVADGALLPFADGSFRVALLLTVLHHAERPEALLTEAARVADRVLVVEDVHRNRLHRLLTCAVDSLLNLELRGHPHNNRSDHGWRETFARLGLSCRVLGSRRILWLFRQQAYEVRRAPPD